MVYVQTGIRPGEWDTYVVLSISFQIFFVQVFKIVVDSWKFSILLLYILWDDRPIFMISGSNQQLQQLLEYTNAPVHNSILVTDYLTKMNIKTVPQPPYSPDFAPCDFCLFPRLRGCRYETIEEMKEAVTRVMDTLTQEDFHEAFQKLLERYNMSIAAGRDYFEGD